MLRNGFRTESIASIVLIQTRLERWGLSPKSFSP